MMMENTFGFPTVGLGKHRRPWPRLLHNESAHCPISDSLKGHQGHEKVNIADTAP